MKNPNNDERREYFRIDDEIYLDIEVISESEYNSAPDILNNLHNDSFSLRADFATLNNNIHPVLNNIKQLHPDISLYLEFINKKIDALGEHLLFNSKAYEECKRIKANISASGIMFETSQKINTADYVKLEVVLFPEKIGILIFGKVIGVSENESRISITFEHIRDEDQELMIKHNLSKQMTDLRIKNNFN